MQDWLGMTAADLGRGIATEEIDPVALCDVYLAAIDAHPLRDRVFACVTHERARAEAQASALRAKAGQRLSLLDGVPVSWKDLFDTAGIATEAGSKLLEGRVPSDDALVVQNATAAGLVCLGKVHMSELAFSGLGYNPSTATPPCVNDAAAVPGGSSSGSAASVAFRLAAASIGTDTGGSVRIPAAWNDLVGFKTTHGRLSLEGVVPLALKFDTIGPLCRTVEDAALLTAALEGKPSPDLRGATLKGRKFAILETVMFDDVRDAPLGAFTRAVEKMEAAGAIIERIKVPAVQTALEISGPLITSEAYGLWGEVIEKNPEKMYSEILQRFRLGREHSGPEYVAAWAKLDAARRAYDSATAGYDAVLAPTAAALPPNLERLNTEPAYYVTENLLALRNTRIGNLLGLCSLTLPTDTPSCGLMLMAAPDFDSALLRLGGAVEAALV
jgi:aspartyl-tRNA(Asn)/glutamyl-tRNA(Gln) amidotransferase subunit A